MDTRNEQQAPPHAEPQKEHQWLQRLVGEWTYESEGEMAPGETAKFAGTERVHTLGGLWFVAEGEGEMPGGGQAKTIMTLGYDPQKNRYVGTFIASMMTYLWVYEGELNATETVLTLNAEGPNFAEEGSMAQYRDAIEFKSDDLRVLTSHMQAEDGTWQPFMTATYRRKR